MGSFNGSGPEKAPRQYGAGWLRRHGEAEGDAALEVRSPPGASARRSEVVPSVSVCLSDLLSFLNSNWEKLYLSPGSSWRHTECSITALERLKPNKRTKQKQSVSWVKYTHLQTYIKNMHDICLWVEQEYRVQNWVKNTIYIYIHILYVVHSFDNRSWNSEWMNEIVVGEMSESVFPENW